MNLERSQQQRLVDNLQAVRDRIGEAAVQAHRNPREITLVAVTKYVDEESTRQLFAAGCHDLAENRPQQFWQKAEQLAELAVRWHFIGHLQRNKVRKTLPHVSLLHSTDSVRLMEAIDRLNAEIVPPRTTELLLEVNTSGDMAKHGFHNAECAAALDLAASLPHLHVRGLMCMAGLGTDGDAARRDFAALRELRDQLRTQFPEMELNELSMGMSSDFEAAIAEGATIVRVGSLLFEGILSSA